MISHKERQYLCWFLSVPGIGAVTGMRIAKQFKSFEEIYNIEGKNLEQAGLLRPKEAAAFDAEKCSLDKRKRELEQLEKEGIRLVAFLDENYPKRLLQIPDYPVGLFVRGGLPDEERPAAAVIGARDCTNYGRQEAESVAAELARAGVQIISGLSDVLLVMEARQKSGSLITAGIGLEQGKEIFALPGRVSDPLSEGCNRLISEGAGVLLGPEEVLEYLALKAGKILRVHEKNENGLAKKEKMVYSCLDLQPKGLEEIVILSGLSVSECIGTLLDLELGGYVVQTSHQYYGKRL